MSTAVKVVPPVQPEVTGLATTCQEVAEQCALARFEIAVKSRVEQGIRDDNDLRLTDELLHGVVLGADATEAAAKPWISAAHALHKALIATVAPFNKRWDTMRSQLDALIRDYGRRKQELARQQQAEIDRAAEEQRKRAEAEAKKAMRSGDIGAAQEALQRAQNIVAPVIQTAAPILENSSMRTVWCAEVVDPMAVVKAMAAGVIPLSAIKEWDTVFLKKEAARRGGLVSWPGVRVWQDESLRVKR